MSIPSSITESTIGASDDYVKSPPADHIDIREHGARVDGSHDDRAAIQSAIDAAAQSGTPDAVYFPPGTTLVGNQVYVTGRHSGVTLCGAGSKSHLQLGGGHTTNAAVFKIYAYNDGPLRDLTIRDLRIDGQKEKQSATNVRGITAIESGKGDGGHLVENVWFHDAAAVNCLWGLPGTTLRYISSWGAQRWHGLGIGCDVDNADDPIVVEYCHFRDNGTHGIDASGGHSVIRHVLSEENGWGGKNTGQTRSSRWENVVFRNNEYLGYMTSGAVGGTLSMNRVMAKDNGLSGFYFQGGASRLEIGELVAIGNQASSHNGNIYMTDDFPVSADSIRSGSSLNGPGIRLNTGPSGSIRDFTHDGSNDDGGVINDSNVAIEATRQATVETIPIPTNPDVSGDSSTGDAALPHLLVVDGSKVTDSLSYQLTVSGEIEKTDEVGSINSYDTIDGSTVDGWVTETVDGFRFSGEITDMSFARDPEYLKIFVDGEQIFPDTTLPHLLVVDGSKVTDSLSYQLTVSGEIEKTDEVGSINQYDTIDGSTVDGWVTETVDGFRFSGEITDMSFARDPEYLKIFVDGEQIFPETSPERTLVIQPTDTTMDLDEPLEFFIKTDGALTANTTESVTFFENDTVAVGFSYWWPTEFSFRGELVEAHIPPEATVVFDGKEMSPADV